MKEIQDIQIGEEVYSRNELSREQGLKKVVNVFVNQTNILIKIQLGNELIETTPTHPFWVEGYGWKPAAELTERDSLSGIDGTFIRVTSVEQVFLDEPVYVYNFEVKDWHTYFVGENEVFVHNACSFENTATHNFWETFYKVLPRHLRSVAIKKFKFFRNDPYHRSLKFERMPEIGKDVWAVKINDQYRALGRMSGGTINWYEVNDHYKNK